MLSVGSRFYECEKAFESDILIRKNKLNSHNIRLRLQADMLSHGYPDEVAAQYANRILKMMQIYDKMYHLLSDKNMRSTMIMFHNAVQAELKENNSANQN